MVADSLLPVPILDMSGWSWMAIEREIELWHMVYLGEHEVEELVEFDEEPSQA